LVKVAYSGPIKVIHGANDGLFEVAGAPVGSVQASLVEAFNIPGDALAFVNGKVVEYEYRLQTNDVLEFMRPWGRKGTGSWWGRDHSENEPNDYYPTPVLATRALLEREEFGTTVWEPACGDGAISRALEQVGYRVISSDIVDRGYGHVENFLSSRRRVESIITNPPFKLAEEFIRRALDLTTFKVAMFLRLSFLESQQRYHLFTQTPLKAVYVFSRRLTLYRAGIARSGSGAVAYAWYVWQHGYRGEPRLRWMSPEAGMGR